MNVDSKCHRSMLYSEMSKTKKKRKIWKKISKFTPLIDEESFMKAKKKGILIANILKIIYIQLFILKQRVL